MMKPLNMQGELAELLAAERARLQALVDGDWAVLQSLFDNELVITHSNGRRDSRETFLYACTSGALRYLQMEQDLSAITLRRDHAVVSAILRGSVVVPGGMRIDIHALSTAVWTRGSENGSWRLLAVHTTSIPSSGTDTGQQQP